MERRSSVNRWQEPKIYQGDQWTILYEKELTPTVTGYHLCGESSHDGSVFQLFAQGHWVKNDPTEPWVFVIIKMGGWMKTSAKTITRKPLHIKRFYAHLYNAFNYYLAEDNFSMWNGRPEKAGKILIRKGKNSKDFTFRDMDEIHAIHQEAYRRLWVQAVPPPSV